MDMPWQRIDDIRAHPWVVLGCGYTGERLARRLLAAGARVWLTRRTQAAADALADALIADAESRAQGGPPSVSALALDADRIAGERAAVRTDQTTAERADETGERAEQRADERDRLIAWMPAGALVVDSIPPGSASPLAEAARVRAVARAGASRLIYLSSTGVYPPGDGDWIDETTPCDPSGPRGRARLAAETAAQGAARECALPAVSLRIVGIYGPGRGVVSRMRAGGYRVIGDGATWVNRVHVDDLCAAILAAALAPVLPRAIYNVADDEPAPSAVYADAVADALGLPPPPRVPVAEVDPRIAAMLTANRRVSNAAIKRELGLSLRYPTWRDSLPALLAEPD